MFELEKWILGMNRYNFRTDYVNIILNICAIKKLEISIFNTWIGIVELIGDTCLNPSN